MEEYSAWDEESQSPIDDIMLPSRVRGNAPHRFFCPTVDVGMPSKNDPNATHASLETSPEGPSMELFSGSAQGMTSPRVSAQHSRSQPPPHPLVDLAPTQGEDAEMRVQLVRDHLGRAPHQTAPIGGRLPPLPPSNANPPEGVSPSAERKAAMRHDTLRRTQKGGSLPRPHLDIPNSTAAELAWLDVITRKTTETERSIPPTPTTLTPTTSLAESAAAGRSPTKRRQTLERSKRLEPLLPPASSGESEEMSAKGANPISENDTMGRESTQTLGIRKAHIAEMMEPPPCIDSDLRRARHQTLICEMLKEGRAKALDAVRALTTLNSDSTVDEEGRV